MPPPLPTSWMARAAAMRPSLQSIKENNANEEAILFGIGRVLQQIGAKAISGPSNLQSPATPNNDGKSSSSTPAAVQAAEVRLEEPVIPVPSQSIESPVPSSPPPAVVSSPSISPTPTTTTTIQPSRSPNSASSTSIAYSTMPSDNGANSGPKNGRPVNTSVIDTLLSNNETHLTPSPYYVGSDSSSQRGLSALAIGGIIAAVVTVVILLSVGLFVRFRRRRQYHYDNDDIVEGTDTFVAGHDKKLWNDHLSMTQQSYMVHNAHPSMMTLQCPEPVVLRDQANTNVPSVPLTLDTSMRLVSHLHHNDFNEHALQYSPAEIIDRGTTSQPLAMCANSNSPSISLYTESNYSIELSSLKLPFDSSTAGDQTPLQSHNKENGPIKLAFPSVSENTSIYPVESSLSSSTNTILRSLRKHAPITDVETVVLPSSPVESTVTIDKLQSRVYDFDAKRSWALSKQMMSPLTSEQRISMKTYSWSSNAAGVSHPDESRVDSSFLGFGKLGRTSQIAQPSHLPEVRVGGIKSDSTMMPGLFFIVKKSFESSNSNTCKIRATEKSIPCLNVHEGDPVFILQDLKNGWVMARSPDGQAGAIPKDILFRW